MEKYSKKTFNLYAQLFKIKKNTLFLLAFMLVGMSFAQQSRPKVTVLNIDTKGLSIDPASMGSMVRIQLEKLDTFEVMDRYDVTYVVEKNKLNIANCYGKICLVEIGEIINSDKMFTGSVELLGETIVVTFRVIDVKTKSIEKIQVNEYLNLPEEIQSMVKVSIAQLFNKPYDENLLVNLSKKNNYEGYVNNNNAERVNLSGPRSGFVYYTGEAGKRVQEDRSSGGYGSYPIMFQFGYQFEKQYLNEGNYQALFEVIPAISGFNQNVFIPSLTFLNGFRNNKHGWEIAFGPTFGLISKAKGYYDNNNQWQLASGWTDTVNVNPYKIEERIDSRGKLELQAGFIIAAGKTFKSGRLNIPVNVFVVPNRDGIRFGASFGFNAKRR